MPPRKEMARKYFKLSMIFVLIVSFLERVDAEITFKSTRNEVCAAINSQTSRNGRLALGRHVQPHFYINSQSKVLMLHKANIHTTFDWHLNDLALLSYLMQAMNNGKGTFVPAKDKVNYTITLNELKNYFPQHWGTWHIQVWPRAYQFTANSTAERGHLRDNNGWDIGPVEIDAEGEAACKNSKVTLHVNFDNNGNIVHKIGNDAASGSFYIEYKEK